MTVNDIFAKVAERNRTDSIANERPLDEILAEAAAKKDLVDLAPRDMTSDQYRAAVVASMVRQTGWDEEDALGALEQVGMDEMQEDGVDTDDAAREILAAYDCEEP